MKIEVKEVKWVNRFLKDEVPGSIGLKYPPDRIKKHFNINIKDGSCVFRKKK